MKKVLICISLLLGAALFYLFYPTAVAVSVGIERPRAVITLNNGTTFKIELYPEEAPNTVTNFIELSKSDFYHKTFLNRKIPGYLIQMGDPIGNGHGFPGYVIKSECRYNGVDNKLKHTKGTVSMARSSQFNTEGSQFFILLTDDASLNGQYSAFGRVIEGLDDLETISYNENQQQMLWIESIDVEETDTVWDELEVIAAFKQKGQTEENIQ